MIDRNRRTRTPARRLARRAGRGFACALIGSGVGACTPRAPLAVPTVIIDAGHGGRDSGTRGAGVSRLPEKDIVLAIATQVTRLLRHQGVRVITTRDTDTFIPLDDRAKLADTHQVALLVSIHADAAKDPSASGATLYVRRGDDPAGRHAAECVRGELEYAGIKCRGINTADFRVLARHSRPAILIECGYLTNPADARRLNSVYYQRLMADAIAKGIITYMRPDRTSK